MDLPQIPPYLEVSFRETTSADVLSASGELDLASAPLLQEHLSRLIGRGRAIIVDFSDLEYLDMKGVHVLEDCCQRAKREGQYMVLVGSSSLVRKILSIARLDERLPVVHTMAEALNALRRQGTAG